MDRLLDRLGATSFSAAKLEFVDPAIHDVTAERRVAGVPDGVVVETLRAGWRSASGALVAKACVAVNRRPSHEPVGH
jgi:molecular chaperone GrpE (heat shock protein)